MKRKNLTTNLMKKHCSEDYALIEKLMHGINKHYSQFLESELEEEADGYLHLRISLPYAPPGQSVYILIATCEVEIIETDGEYTFATNVDLHFDATDRACRHAVVKAIRNIIHNPDRLSADNFISKLEKNFLISECSELSAIKYLFENKKTADFLEEVEESLDKIIDNIIDEQLVKILVS